MEIGKNVPPKEVEPQRGAKQQRGLQTRSATEAERRGDHETAAAVWASCMELDGALLHSDASIRDF